MSEISRWVERKFAFDFPVEMYPDILIRLRGTPGRLDQLTHGLKREIDLEALWVNSSVGISVRSSSAQCRRYHQFENGPGAP